MERKRDDLTAIFPVGVLFAFDKPKDCKICLKGHDVTYPQNSLKVAVSSYWFWYDQGVQSVSV